MINRMTAFILFAMFVAPAIALPSDNSAQAAAIAMVTRFEDAWNRADGAAYGENYWPEAELVDPSGVIVTGRAAIVQEHVDLWAGIFKGSRIVGTIRRIQMPGSDYMIVDVDLDLSGIRQPPRGSPADAARALRSHLKHVMAKRHGAWKIISAQNTFVSG